MKKIMILIFICSFAVTGYAQINSFSRWSVTAEYGYNYFDGDIKQTGTSLFPTSNPGMSFGGTVEYSLTPAWGLALDSYFSALKAESTSPAFKMNTSLYSSDLNVTLNVTKFVLPYSTSKFQINASVGLGVAGYIYDVTPSTLALDSKYGFAGSIPVTLSLEYNLSKTMALGLKAHYTSYTKDNLEGVTKLGASGIMNDYVAAGTLFLRYKINSIKKNHMHNMNMDVYNPELTKTLSLAKESAAEIDKLSYSLHNLETMYLDQRKQLDSVMAILSNKGSGIDGDVVPNRKDLAKINSSTEPVSALKKPLLISVYNDRMQILNKDVLAVYFDYDKIEFADRESGTLRKIADKMKADKSLLVEVRSYSDYKGDIPYTKLLSQKRADRVKEELVKVWGIASERVISNGQGKDNQPQSDSVQPSERCDIFFTKL